MMIGFKTSTSTCAHSRACLLECTHTHTHTHTRWFSLIFPLTHAHCLVVSLCFLLSLSVFLCLILSLALSLATYIYSRFPVILSMSPRNDDAWMDASVTLDVEQDSRVNINFGAPRYVTHSYMEFVNRWYLGASLIHIFGYVTHSYMEFVNYWYMEFVTHSCVEFVTQSCMELVSHSHTLVMLGPGWHDDTWWSEVLAYLPRLVLHVWLDTRDIHICNMNHPCLWNDLC